MKNLKTICLSLLLLGGGTAAAGATAEPVRVNVFDHVVFYDGYNSTVFDAGLDDGVYRMKNSLYSTPLPMEQLTDLGDGLTLDVTIGALCDNYDRISSLCLAFVPKGASTYDYDKVRRIEIARLITPFMNKNISPTEVPYTFDIPNVANLLRDPALRADCDLWMEFEVFGVPYAANKEVAGCSGRNDVFEGTVDLVYTPAEEARPSEGNVLVPINVKYLDDRGNINFNNYTESATDTLGITTKTYEFEVPEDVADSKVYLILTNHGANSGGEEYVRRLHLVYYDGDIVLSYTPGGVSCEPYRVYNTQPNGIYANSRPESFWKTQSNWCPGQAVPIREIPLGAQKAGKHKVMIRVPDARFVGKDGDFRPSLYFHGVKNGAMPTSVDEVWFEGPTVTLHKEGDVLRYSSDEPVEKLLVHTADGVLARAYSHPQGEVALGDLPSGMLILTFVTEDGRTTVRQILH